MRRDYKSIFGEMEKPETIYTERNSKFASPLFYMINGTYSGIKGIKGD
jgi:hypothetical protein